MLRGIAAVLIIGASVVSAPALACKGPNVLFADDFSVADAAWGDVDDRFIIANNQLTLKPAPGKNYGGLYSGSIFDDADICIDVVIPQSKDAVVGGVYFWTDPDDTYKSTYEFLVASDGSASIQRTQKGRWLTVVNWKKAPALKTAAGAVNTLRIKLKGQTITAYINDQQFATLKGTPPSGGGFVGVDGGSLNTGMSTWVFSNLKITDVP